MPYKPKCAKGVCTSDAKWVRIKMKRNAPYYLCNVCYQTTFPAGQTGIFVAYPRIRE